MCKPPVVGELGAVEGADVRLGVPYVNGQQHARDYDGAVATARLFVIPGSHPSLAARLMLEAKGIPYKRVDLVPVVSKGVVRAAGFPGKTVPALKVEGRKVQGSREIARALDEITPDPPLFPSDAGRPGEGGGGRDLGRRAPPAR